MPEPHRARLTARVLDRHAQLAQRGPRALDQRLSRAGELDGLAPEQRRPDLALEAGDLLAQRGLGDVQPPRGAREVQLIPEHHEGLEQAQVDPHAAVCAAPARAD